MEIKAAELCVLYREKYPQVFTQNCNHLHIYGKKHSRANAESGNDYLKIQMKHSKGLPNKQKTLMDMTVLLPFLQAATYLPRNILTYYFQVFSPLLFQCCPPLSSSLYLSFSPSETFLTALQFLLRGKGWLSHMLVSVLTNQQPLEISNHIWRSG